MNRLADRVVLVTGSTGIAAAAAVRLSGEGASLFVTSRTEDHARALAERLVASGAAAGWRSADLADEGQVGDVVEACLERFGRIDGLLAVAGGSGRRLGDGPIHAVDGDAWDATLALNQEPNSAGSRGSIALIGSVTATDPAPQHFATHAYAAARGATIALMRSMAATYARDRIRVNVVAPSLTDTPMAARAARDPEIRAFAAGKQPLAGELMDPAEVAHAVVYFLSDESRAVTGQLLKVDGGWSVTSFGGPVA